MPGICGLLGAFDGACFARIGTQIGTFFGERPLDELGAVAWVRRVVAVDLGRLGVSVAHPFLDRAQRRPGGRHLGAEGVAQLMEGDLVHAGAVDRLAEALADLRGVEDVPSQRVAEDEVGVSAIAGAFREQIELARNAVSERNRSPLVGFGGVPSSACVVLSDS